MKSDVQLKQDIENELKWEPSVNEAHIGVSVTSGVVTLSGHVASYAEKYDAEDAVKRIYAVKGLANELDVHLPGSTKYTDEDIAIACTKAIQSSDYVPKDKVKVVVRNGWVILEGELEWNFQKEAAATAIRNLRGICGVTNKIGIKKRNIPADVKSKIAAAFHRSADIDARRIHIEANDGTIVLSGSVRSWMEREEAQRAAWAAPGVTEVDNHISVVP